MDDAGRLQGRRALVTGASSGIGAALARALAADGAVVAVSARRADRLDEVLADCRTTSPSSVSLPMDLAEPDAPERLVAAAEQALGGIDVLVNNAGMPKRRAVERLTTTEVEQVVRLNLLSAMRLTLAAVPGMRAQGWGRIVVMSSVAARLSPPGESAYVATKAGLAAFHESLAAELWGSGVTVHLVHPGVIDTELYDVPGNDPVFADVEALPAEAVVAPTLQAVREGTIETWVPEWFADVATMKANDLAGYLQGAAEYRAQQLAGTEDGA